MKRFLFTFCVLCIASALWAETAKVNGITLTYSYVSSGGVMITDCSEYAEGSLNIPSTLNGFRVVAIEEGAFYNCTDLTSITIPSNVTRIGDGAFWGCSGLDSITIPSSVITIGREAFCSCSRLTSITIPSGVTTIKAYTFADCSRLTAVTIPEGMTSIEEGAFSSCSRLISITIPSRVTTIGDHVFSNCSALGSVNIPEGVTKIGNSTFYKCSSLTSITIPEGVTAIGSDSFYGCSGLTSMIIPRGVTTIGDEAFANCSGLTSIEFNGPPPKSVGDLAFPSTFGYYLPEYASEWKDVIVDGKWNNLTMINVSSFEVSIVMVGNGTVSGVGSYAEGDEVVVTAIAEEGWTFCGWSTTPIMMEANYTFIMPSTDIELTAYFAPSVAITQAINHYVETNGLMTKEEAKEALLAADEVFTIEEMKAMSFGSPIIVVGEENIDIAISLQTAESLDVWQALTLEGATIEFEQSTGIITVTVPKGDKKVAFYKFVVPEN